MFTQVDVCREVQYRRAPAAVQRVRGGDGSCLHQRGLDLRLAHDPERPGSRLGSRLELLEMRRRKNSYKVKMGYHIPVITFCVSAGA